MVPDDRAGPRSSGTTARARWWRPSCSRASATRVRSASATASSGSPTATCSRCRPPRSAPRSGSRTTTPDPTRPRVRARGARTAGGTPTADRRLTDGADRNGRDPGSSPTGNNPSLRSPAWETSWRATRRSRRSTSCSPRPRSPRRHALALHDALQTLSPADFADRCAARDRAFRDQGITFQLSGEERPFPLDLVPRIIPSDEWSVIERGVRQRVLALEAFLGDVYGAGRILADRVIPRRLVITSKHFHRQVAGIRPEHGVRIHVAGVDLVRDGAGRLPGARGQPARAVGDLVRGGEPAGDDPGVPRALRQPPRAPGRLVPDQAARGAAPHRAERCRRPVRGGADARRAQLRVLRALVPRPPDGRRAGGGQRPRRAGRDALHAHDRWSAARRRRVPPHRRRLPRPVAVPARLRGRLRGDAARGPGRPGDDRRTRPATASPTTRPSTRTSPR